MQHKFVDLLFDFDVQLIIVTVMMHFRMRSDWRTRKRVTQREHDLEMT